MAFVNAAPVLRTSLGGSSAAACTQVKRAVPRVNRWRSRLPVRAVATGSYVREVSGEQLDEAVKANARPIVLDAYADWVRSLVLLSLRNISSDFLRAPFS